MPEQTYDALVIGGGPAGSTCGALLAQHGRRVLIVERGQFPRFHIGESLMPETYWVFQRLGVLDKLKSGRFVKKYSVQFYTAAGQMSAPFYFDERDPRECSQTWQVLRSEFDQMMLANAAEKGAEIWQHANVADVVHEPSPRGGPCVTGAIIERADGRTQIVHARVVVDATGTNAMLSRKFNLRQPDPALRKAAVFAHYKGAFRDPNPRDEGATLVLQLANARGWFWYIPLQADVVSIGVVADIDYLIKGRGTPEEILAEEIKRCRLVDERLARAERVSPVHVLSDFSYGSKACAGDGWVLIGDALTFLDPMYSSGVFLALKSGELAADAIHEALTAGDCSAERLGAWGDGFYAGVQAIRKLVYAFYTPGFSFGQFVRAHPECKDTLVRLLIGDVLKRDVDEIFEPMGKFFDVPADIGLDAQRR